jgi:predicted NAD/FAD-binding protein
MQQGYGRIDLTKRIGVIGGGISGLVSAYLLSEQYDVCLFEANDYLGGHTHTVDVELDNQKLAIDTGFIVFNQKTYPQFCKLLNTLNVAFEASEMSFSFMSAKLGLEYNGHDLNTLFSQRRNLFSPRFYRFLWDIVRFNRQAKHFLQHSGLNPSIAEFVAEHRYGELFREGYLLPMLASVWSTNLALMMQAPARVILAFCENHGLLNITDRPPWYVISGGSKNYIAPLTQRFRDKIFLNSPVSAVVREGETVQVHTASGMQTFDYVVLATHSDQALRMLASPTAAEQTVLGALQYQHNEVVLHYDDALLPKNKLSRASWNYNPDNYQDGRCAVTYYMNRLQNLSAARDYCVSVNLTEKIAPEKVLGRYLYSHPVMSAESVAAQGRFQEINGKDKIFYCGAYWGNGFHEDGVVSALAACKPLGVAL